MDKVPFAWDMPIAGGNWRVTDADGKGVHMAGYYEMHLIEEVERLRSKLESVLDSIRQCAGSRPFDSGGRHGMYCSECGQYESTGKHLDNCWRRFAFEEPE